MLREREKEKEREKGKGKGKGEGKINYILGGIYRSLLIWFC